MIASCQRIEKAPNRAISLVPMAVRFSAHPVLPKSLQSKQSCHLYSLSFLGQTQVLQGARDGVSREVPCSALKGETVPDSLPATPKSPPSLGFSSKNAGVGCHFLLQCMKVKSESEVAQLCLTLCDPTRGNPACRGTFGGRRKAVWDRLALQGGTGDFP